MANTGFPTIIQPCHNDVLGLDVFCKTSNVICNVVYFAEIFELVPASEAFLFIEEDDVPAIYPSLRFGMTGIFSLRFGMTAIFSLRFGMNCV